MVALSGLDKVRPPHLTRETLSGRRPADGADTLGGVFRPRGRLSWFGAAAADWLTRKRGEQTLSLPLNASVYGKYDMPSMRLLKNCGRFDIRLPGTRSGRDRALPI